MVFLCVDDDPEDIELFSEAIKSIDSNYTCMVAVNGSDALKKLSVVRPDYIFPI
jgi:CheY-like chemotaxis protein